jgi:GTP pyrophosphokinase
MLDVDPDLEELCKTPKARTAINKLLQNKRRRYAREVGKEIVFQEIPRHGLSRDILEGERVQFILEVLNMKDLSELYEHIGQDRLSPHVFLYYFIDESSLHRSKDQNRLSNALILPDERNTLSVSQLHKGIHKFARCCNPYPRQEDVVAVLSERGVTFHHTSCRELRRHNFHPYRLLKVQWNREGSWPTPLEFQLRIEQQTPVSFFTSFSPNLPGHVRIRSLETAKKKSCRSFTRMVVELSGFEDASSFFGSLPVERLTIEKYNRVRRSRSLPCSTS